MEVIKRRINAKIEKNIKEIARCNEMLQAYIDEYLKGYYRGKITELEHANHELKMLLMLMGNGVEEDDI